MRVFQRGDNWYVDYSVKGRRRREKIGPNKRLAEIALEKIRAQTTVDNILTILGERGIDDNGWKYKPNNILKSINNSDFELIAIQPKGKINGQIKGNNK